VARRSEPKERGSKPCVSNPRCGLRGRLTCGWHSATGEQSASSRQTAAEQRAARRSATSCSPRQPFRRLIRADRERPVTLRRPWRPEWHLRRTCGAETGRQRGHQPRPGAARSEERRSGALLRRSATARAAKRSPLLHLQEHSAAHRTGLVHCVGPQGVAPARSRGASARLAGCRRASDRKSHFSPKDQYVYPNAKKPTDCHKALLPLGAMGT
jgi:hypothetical protein